MAKKESKKEQLGFELKSGEKFAFKSPQFRMRFDDKGDPADEGTSRVVTAAEAAENPKICAHLVKIKSGVIVQLETKKGGK